MAAGREVLEGLMFFPRGGSAQVVRSLARHLPAHGWSPRILSGSLAGAGDARRFFAGLPVEVVDFTPAAAAADPLAHDPPFHPSYEDRPGAPDRVFARVDDAGCERQVRAWAAALARARAADADVLHLHHLTPLNEAAARVAPAVPVVGHLHGTELLMLEDIAAGPPPGWEHAAAWQVRMRRWAHGCALLVLLDDGQAHRAEELLDVEHDRTFTLPNGFDPEVFRRDPRLDRLAHWRRHLVTEPRGWAPGGAAGSIAYAEEDLAWFAPGMPVLLYVGRFTAVKRVGLLVRAVARARREHGLRAPLVIVGGHPGEWEGEHPLDAVRETGVGGVFLAGWHEHDELPAFLSASDVLVLPSVREQFGQVVVEAMACEVPPVAVAAHGPATIIEPGETGWLVPGDDEEALSAALVEAADRPAERERRAVRARRVALDRYGWPNLAGRLAARLDALVAALVLALVLALPAAASAADPGRWRLVRATTLRSEYFQGIASDPARRLFFSGVFVGVYRTDPRLVETARVADAIPPDVRAQEGYDHVGDITWDAGGGGRLLLPLECYTPGAPDPNPCKTGAVGLLDPETLAWEGYARLDPAAIPKAMWIAVRRGEAWTQSGRDLLVFRTADLVPGRRDVAPVRRYAGAVPAGAASGAAWVDGRLLLAGARGATARIWSWDPVTGRSRVEVERGLSGESEGLDAVPLLGGTLQWMVEPVTPTPPPTYPRSTLLTFARIPPPVLRIAVSPRRLRAGVRAGLAVRVTRRGRGVSGARVTGLGARAVTGRDGRARLVVRPRRAGMFALRATLPESRAGVVRVAVRR